MTIPETNSSVRRSAEKLGEQANSSASHLRDTAMNAGEEIGTATKAEFNNIMSDLQDLIVRARKLSGQELTVIRQQISEKLGDARGKLQGLSEEASQAANKGLEGTEQMIRSNPLQAVGIAAAVGLVIGFLINRR